LDIPHARVQAVAMLAGCEGGGHMNTFLPCALAKFSAGYRIPCRITVLTATELRQSRPIQSRQGNLVLGTMEACLIRSIVINQRRYLASPFAAVRR